MSESRIRKNYHIDYVSMNIVNRTSVRKVICKHYSPLVVVVYVF